MIAANFQGNCAVETRLLRFSIGFCCFTASAPSMEAVVIKGFFAVLSWLFGFGAEK
jgi:hypothetical protein